MTNSTLDKKEKAKIRIRLKSYDHHLIDNSCKQIIDIAIRSGASIVGPILLPTEKRKYSVNRATFVKKKSQEQFEIRVHKRLIDVINSNSKTVEALTSLNLPAGVEAEIKA